MSEMWLWLLLILIVLVAYWYLTVPQGLPPGENGLPVVGYLPFMESHIHKSFIKLGKKHGGLFYVYLGNRLVVVLNDYATAKEAFINQGENFAGRPHDVFFRESKEDNMGLMVADGEFWKQQRRFLLTYLRDYGVGKLTLEPKLLVEIRHFLDEIKKQKEKPFNIQKLIAHSLGNNIHIFLSGHRYDYDHPMIREILDIYKSFGRFSKVKNVKMFFPWAVHIPGVDWLTKRKEARMLIDRFVKLVERIVNTVKKEYKDGDGDNYIHAYLTEKNNRSKTNQKEEIFIDLALFHNISDILAAGTNTTSSTLMWAVLYLTNYPDIQKKVQKEIDEVIGTEREPSYNDRINMPYTEATICEVHRIVSHAPMSIEHRNLRETSINGYRIPRDTMIMVNLWNIHHDAELWGDPENFRPDRFINENGQLTKPEYLVPFSLGKRACVGEPLARMELFLYFVSLLQHFDFGPPNGVRPTLETVPGIVTLNPQAVVVCAKSRQN